MNVNNVRMNLDKYSTTILTTVNITTKIHEGMKSNASR